MTIKKIRNFTIFGKNFGLYGYLPSLIFTKNVNVHLLENYKDALEKRDELLPFIKKIIWYENENDLMRSIDSCVIAVPPSSQNIILEKIIKFDNIKNIILEKPPASNPAKAKELLIQIKRYNLNVNFSFSFLYCKWYQRIKKLILESRKPLYIEWNFKAYHFSKNQFNWKRDHYQGGGPLRFYGIHLLSVIADIGSQHCSSSKLIKDDFDFQSKWESEFKLDSGMIISLILNSNNEKKLFEIGSKEGDTKLPFLKIEDPFIQEEKIDNHDIKLNILKKLINQSNKLDQTKINYYENLVNLWGACESKITYE